MSEQTTPGSESERLDAIEEQAELEERHQLYAEQVGDIENSQHQLEELIRRINKQSKELFEESFEAVRINFQELFRKLFGGGRADTERRRIADVGLDR